jgi:CDP-diacylglycerol--glycerol-3-phosphate 3-phosphatidyltransferase
MNPVTGQLRDLPYLLGFIAFFTIPFIIHGVQVLRGAIKLPASRPGGAGARLFGPLFISYYYWLMGPVFRYLARTRWTPNQVTVLTLVVAAATAVAIATGHFALASALVIGGGTLDIIDGQLARTKNMATAAGAFLDSTVDRICDGLVFGGCVVYYAGTPIMYVALAVLVMSFTVSYARSRAEFFGITGSGGLMQRADRLAVLGMALAFSSFFGHRHEGFVPHPFYAVTAGALCLMAVLNTITAVRRILWTMEQFRRRGREPAQAQIRPTAPANVVLLEPKADGLLGSQREPALRIGG